MELDINGKPTRAKNSQLVIASDKNRGILGKADLDLSQFGTTDFQVHILELYDCAYEGAFVEVSLKGAEKRRASQRTPTPSQS